MITPIGVIHTPYTSLEKVPIQPCYSSGVGEIELFKEYEEGPGGFLPHRDPLSLPQI
jgi:tRNA (Thr-GGU) A37 N-methylase